MKHESFDFDLSSFGEEDTYDYVKLAYENNPSAKLKILFVLDKIPSEDLHSGKLLSGQTGDLLNVLVSTTKRLYARSAPSFSWLAVSFNAFRTFGKSQEFRTQAEALFAERIKCLITRYKPDYVVGFGTSVTAGLIPTHLKEDSKGRIRYSYWLGVPVNTEIKYKKLSHETTYLANLSLDSVVRGFDAEASMLGYMCRCLAPALGTRYEVDSKALHNHKSVLVKDIAHFKKLMAYMRRQKSVSIDTEAASLRKVTNTLFTVQMAANANTGYIVPIYHKDTPFTPKELRYICADFKDFFEGGSENEYHIYTNAKFDLTLLRESFGIRYFAQPVWDILGGEFALDENLRNLDTMIGEYYYSLGNLSVQYGFDGYLSAEFSKQHRANFDQADLTSRAVQHYCTLDVCVPFAIHEQQKRRAAYVNYEKYEKVVLNEISDTIHAFSTMEHTGAGLDVPYLFFLKTDQSPIEAEIRKMTADLLSTGAVRKTNAMLCKQKAIPQGTMFDRFLTSGAGKALSTSVAAPSAFQLNKPDHKKMLFFEVLGLEPLERGASGVGKLDKAFQQAYAHIPEVKAYTSLEKAKKLKNAYVKSFLRMLADSLDLQKDHRIRPNYSYLRVVTHRSAASDPNLQQVPSHSALGKHIKRLFVARKGTLYIKVDYRVHEVRGWGIISFDKGVAAVFAAAKKLRDAYRAHPTPELAKRLKTEADVHIQNAAYFFSVAMDKVDKSLRNAVKGIIFGLIYGMGLKTLAKNIKQTDDFTKKLVDNFSKRFPNAVGWTREVKKKASKLLYAETPTGLRRNLFGYLLPESFEQAGAVSARMDRQAGNAPVQGMCAKFMMNAIRILSRLAFEELKKDENFKLYITNSVHDSLENEAGYANFLLSIGQIEWALTEGVRKIVKQRYGFDLVSDLEVDFEIGATLSECESWDFSVAQLERLVIDSLLFQRNKLKHNIRPDAVMRTIFGPEAFARAPGWMKTQVDNIGWELSLFEVPYIKLLLSESKSKIAAGELALKTAEDTKSKVTAGEYEDAVKSAKSQISEGEDLLQYARELNEYRKEFSRR